MSTVELRVVHTQLSAVCIRTDLRNPFKAASLFHVGFIETDRVVTMETKLTTNHHWMVLRNNPAQVKMDHSNQRML